MAIRARQVHKIADLARLTVDDAVVPELANQLENILAMIEKMNVVDMDHIKPSFHSLEVLLPFREDQVTEKDQRDIFQNIAPQVEAGLYLVPKVIE